MGYNFLEEFFLRKSSRLFKIESLLQIFDLLFLTIDDQCLFLDCINKSFYLS